MRQFPLLLSATASQAAVLFEHATVISYNESLQDYQIYRDASLLVEDDHITKLVNGSYTDAMPADTQIIDATDKIISPGFINTHTHLWQTAYKTIGSNTTLAEYFQRYGEFGQAEQYFSPQDTYLGQLTGSLENIYEGTTTVLDHAHGDFSDETAHAELNATLDSGLRTFYAHAVHPIPNGYPIDNQTKLFDTWAQDPRLQDPDRIVELGLAYDFFYSSPEANISALWKVVQEHNLSVVTTHYLDGPWSVGNSPERLHGFGWLNESVPIVFSHASFATQTDYSLLRSTNQYISTTPESEQHYGHVHPWSHLIQDQASIGVDTHFTFSSSMVQQARTWMQSLREQNFIPPLTQEYKIPANNPMSVKQAFDLITRHGALALRRTDIGVIREGAKADLVVFDTTSPNLLGWWDPIAAIILHSNVGDVEHVLINGKFVKKDRKLTFSGYADLRKKFQASAERIQNIWLNTDWPALTGEWQDISDFTKDTTIDTLRGNGTGY